MRIENHRNQHDDITEQNCSDGLLPTHAARDQARRQHVGGNAHAHGDPQRRVVVDAPGALLGRHRSEVFVVEARFQPFRYVHAPPLAARRKYCPRPDAPDVLPFLDNQLAAREHLPGVALHFEAFEHRIIDAHVVRLRADQMLGFGIPHHDVGVASRRDRALLGIHAEDARRRRGHDLHKSIQRDLARAHAVMMQQLQSILDARPAVGDLGEIVLAQRLLILETERAVIGGDHLQVIGLQPIPQLRQILLLAQRRRKDVLRAFETGQLHVVDREQQILRTGFGKRGQTAIASFAYLIQRILRRQMHDVDGNARNLSQRDGAMDRFRFSQRRASQRVMNWRGLAFGQRLAHDDVDHAAVLCVHADQRAVLRGLLQRAKNSRVVHHRAHSDTP